MPEPAGDLDVDVLVVGGGVVGHYLATQLADRYTVCLLTDPDAPDESLASDGLLSGGYEGNDVARIQPARRAAGYWRLWAEANGVAVDPAPSQWLLDPAHEVAQVRFWRDASLHVERAGGVPAAFRGGSVGGHVTYATLDDVVIDPAAMVRTLRAGVAPCCVEGKVIDVVLAADAAVDAVDAEIDGAIVPIVARYTVFAADASNADLLARTAARTREGTRRRERAEIARTCQAVRKELQLLVRSPELPLVTATFDGIRVVGHRYTDDEVVWVVTPPVDDRVTTLGPEDLRFAPQADRAAVARLVDGLLAASPLLAEALASTRWTVGVRRKTEHPMMAGDVSRIGLPSPAKIETMGLEGFAAVWPGHVSYSMIVGDVVAERAVAYLGRPGGFDPAEVAALAPSGGTAEVHARFVAGEDGWRRWSEFRDLYVSR